MSFTKIEWWVGLFAFFGIIASLFTALQVSNLQSFGNKGEGYQMYAYFDEIGGLKVRAPITVAGVLVGRVSNIVLEKETFQAKITLKIFNNNFSIPEDSSASILTSGILGEKYVGLTPGGMDFNIEPEGVLEQTQSAILIENLISKFLVNTSK